jgi:hypothetical protein
VDYETAYKYASDHQLKDKDGFLQVADAVDRLTWDARKKAEQAEWRESERKNLAKEIETNNKLATLTPPSARNPLHTAPVKEGEFNPFKERTDAKGNKTQVSKSFDEVIAEAANDQDILASAFESASGLVQ